MKNCIAVLILALVASQDDAAANAQAQSMLGGAKKGRSLDRAENLLNSMLQGLDDENEEEEEDLSIEHEILAVFASGGGGSEKMCMTPVASANATEVSLTSAQRCTLVGGSGDLIAGMQWVYREKQAECARKLRMEECTCVGSCSAAGCNCGQDGEENYEFYQATRATVEAGYYKSKSKRDRELGVITKMERKVERLFAIGEDQAAAAQTMLALVENMTPIRKDGTDVVDILAEILRVSEDGQEVINFLTEVKADIQSEEEAALGEWNAAIAMETLWEQKCNTAMGDRVACEAEEETERLRTNGQIAKVAKKEVDHNLMVALRTEEREFINQILQGMQSFKDIRNQVSDLEVERFADMADQIKEVLRGVISDIQEEGAEQTLIKDGAAIDLDTANNMWKAADNALQSATSQLATITSLEDNAMSAMREAEDTLVQHDLSRDHPTNGERKLLNDLEEMINGLHPPDPTRNLYGQMTLIQMLTAGGSDPCTGCLDATQAEINNVVGGTPVCTGLCKVIRLVFQFREDLNREETEDNLARSTRQKEYNCYAEGDSKMTLRDYIVASDIEVDWVTAKGLDVTNPAGIGYDALGTTGPQLRALLEAAVVAKNPDANRCPSNSGATSTWMDMSQTLGVGACSVPSCSGNSCGGDLDPSYWDHPDVPKRDPCYPSHYWMEMADVEACKARGDEWGVESFSWAFGRCYLDITMTTFNTLTVPDGETWTRGGVHNCEGGSRVDYVGKGASWTCYVKGAAPPIPCRQVERLSDDQLMKLYDASMSAGSMPPGVFRANTGHMMDTQMSSADGDGMWFVGEPGLSCTATCAKEMLTCGPHLWSAYRPQGDDLLGPFEQTVELFGRFGTCTVSNGAETDHQTQPSFRYCPDGMARVEGLSASEDGVPKECGQCRGMKSIPEDWSCDASYTDATTRRADMRLCPCYSAEGQTLALPNLEALAAVSPAATEAAVTQITSTSTFFCKDPAYNKKRFQANMLNAIDYESRMRDNHAAADTLNTQILIEWRKEQDLRAEELEALGTIIQLVDRLVNASNGAADNQYLVPLLMIEVQPGTGNVTSNTTNRVQKILSDEIDKVNVKKAGIQAEVQMRIDERDAAVAVRQDRATSHGQDLSERDQWWAKTQKERGTLATMQELYTELRAATLEERRVLNLCIDKIEELAAVPRTEDLEEGVRLHKEDHIHTALLQVIDTLSADRGNKTARMISVIQGIIDDGDEMLKGKEELIEQKIRLVADYYAEYQRWQAQEKVAAQELEQAFKVEMIKDRALALANAYMAKMFRKYDKMIDMINEVKQMMEDFAKIDDRRRLAQYDESVDTSWTAVVEEELNKCVAKINKIGERGQAEVDAKEDAKERQIVVRNARAADLVAAEAHEQTKIADCARATGVYNQNVTYHDNMTQIRYNESLVLDEIEDLVGDLLGIPASDRTFANGGGLDKYKNMVDEDGNPVRITNPDELRRYNEARARVLKQRMGIIAVPTWTCVEQDDGYFYAYCNGASAANPAAGFDARYPDQAECDFNINESDGFVNQNPAFICPTSFEKLRTMQLIEKAPNAALAADPLFHAAVVMMLAKTRARHSFNDYELKLIEGQYRGGMAEKIMNAVNGYRRAMDKENSNDCGATLSTCGEVELLNMAQAEMRRQCDLKDVAIGQREAAEVAKADAIADLAARNAELAQEREEFAKGEKTRNQQKATIAMIIEKLVGFEFDADDAVEEIEAAALGGAKTAYQFDPKLGSYIPCPRGGALPNDICPISAETTVNCGTDPDFGERGCMWEGVGNAELYCKAWADCKSFWCLDGKCYARGTVDGVVEASQAGGNGFEDATLYIKIEESTTDETAGLSTFMTACKSGACAVAMTLAREAGLAGKEESQRTCEELGWNSSPSTPNICAKSNLEGEFPKEMPADMRLCLPAPMGNPTWEGCSPPGLPNPLDLALEPVSDLPDLPGLPPGLPGRRQLTSRTTGVKNGINLMEVMPKGMTHGAGKQLHQLPTHVTVNELMGKKHIYQHKNMAGASLGVNPVSLLAMGHRLGSLAKTRAQLKACPDDIGCAPPALGTVAGVPVPEGLDANALGFLMTPTGTISGLGDAATEAEIGQVVGAAVALAQALLPPPPTGDAVVVDLDPQCSGHQTQAAAESYCYAAGGRLCTIDELEDDATKGSGCNYDWKRTWSSSECTTDDGAAGFYTQAGSTDFKEQLDYFPNDFASPRECTAETEDNRVVTRCCADRDFDAESFEPCSALGWEYQPGWDRTVCSKTNPIANVDGTVGTGACPTAKTYQEAKDFCKAVNARLCTVRELENDAAADSGCTFNNMRVWSRTQCVDPVNGRKIPGHMTAAGASAKAEIIPTQCTQDDATEVVVRCCADADAIFRQTTCGQASWVDKSYSTTNKACGASVFPNGQEMRKEVNGVNLGCSGLMNRLDAENFCRANMARLCFQHELQNGAGAWSGCGYDMKLVWTRTRCRWGEQRGWLAGPGNQKFRDKVILVAAERPKKIQCEIGGAGSGEWAWCDPVPPDTATVDPESQVLPQPLPPKPVNPSWQNFGFRCIAESEEIANARCCTSTEVSE